MKRLTKILSTVMLVIMMVSCFSTVFAATKMNPQDWENDTSINDNMINTGDIKGFSASIINVVSIVGSAAAIITLIILGVKYMMGSAEEKAEYKKTLLPYVIGAAMVFGASLLTGVIYNFMNQG
ncbi:MAG: pilin [Clostridia bacterium]